MSWFRNQIALKVYFTSGKMNVNLKWVIFVELMWNYFWIWSFLDWQKPENVFWADVDERQQLPECTPTTQLSPQNKSLLA